MIVSIPNLNIPSIDQIKIAFAVWFRTVVLSQNVVYCQYKLWNRELRPAVCLLLLDAGWYSFQKTHFWILWLPHSFRDFIDAASTILQYRDLLLPVGFWAASSAGSLTNEPSSDRFNFTAVFEPYHTFSCNMFWNRIGLTSRI